ncbi:Cell wall assembly regulator SMI1 [Singulisphaera sp. GP187]|uniref:SMI1/KNR4 family protein n=1 Tax=Singulisphaera sp. GP187 TaxID=1882752 RepID=UPI000927DF03|nr:SMI1/KNR4 family protein [Singulisphaera sp. GP187]SIO66800.1 Cell wall assembly regulator SMI1 [Singulisphaera sp. GP187]
MSFDGDAAEETEVVIHRLISPPERWGQDDAGLLWNEVLADGNVKTHFWIADDADDRARLEAFWQACQQVDWDEVQIHEVPATSIRKPKFTMPSPVEPPPRPQGSLPEFTDQGLIRRVPHDPAPVAESWQRIEAWMARHCPEVVARLLPGVSEKHIAAFEQAIGQKLPEDVKASYRIHEGIGWVPREYVEMFKGDDEDADEPDFINTVFYDYGLDSIRDDPRNGCEEILPHWQQWTDFADFEDEGAPEGGSFSDSEVFPVDAIQVRYACRGWIPLYASHSNYLGIDLAPGPRGVVGQVINFGRDENEHKSVLATSWAQFLEDYADELEAGNFHFTGGPDDEIGDRYLYMKRPRVSSICHQWKHWAEAKLAPEFQGVNTPPPPDPTLADPETDRECRSVVDGFLADYRAWELRWLAVRPLEQLGFESINERPDGQIRGSIHPLRKYVDEGLPVPEAVAFGKAHEDLDYDEFWEHPWLKDRLNIGPHYAPAMAERSAIFAKYLTAWAQRSQSDNFTLNDSPRFAPKTFEEVFVYRGDEETAYVWSTHISDSLEGERNWRVLLKREGGGWRIERLQSSTEGKPYRSKTIG